MGPCSATAAPPPVPAILPDDLVGRCRFPSPGTAVTCAVSGGADSLALLVLAVHAGCDVTAVHVDHGLRAESAGEADVVADAAARFGAAFRAARVEVAPGPNLEARARAARRSVLPPDALTGHTADDQAETILLNLLRGSGRDGLSGMPDDGRHPLLRIRRSETRALCDALELQPVDDPTNADRRYRRNRVRHELLPLLASIAERDVVPVLVRQGALLGEEAALLDSLAAAIDVTDAKALAAAPPALARRAVRRWLQQASPYPPDAATVERVLGVARLDATGCDVGGGARVRRSGGRLVLEQTN
ncbi:MAG: tRNA lysidine(34) synthetase TilS [Actinobacteria bacterium]|nr:tRNA lysidine(34) synthetase TilS [Actinomycetota bacterium]